ncbi:MAG: nuclear transport factor 2 family protein, partial [Gammaproteobacteria bacterium]|nr:nuclear transport factor 2 family protein [Gammaproteobacteria bacterium]
MQQYAQIVAGLEKYFDGFYRGDVELLKQVFHPNCHLYSATTGEVVDDDMDAVYARVKGREAPDLRNEVRADRIVSIHLSDAVTALATVEIGIGDKLFTDYLNFIFVGGEWRIIA